ncbi:MAG TPA: pirin family protein [Kofleriaceae bacterium]|nr:pirin family protein [Kofleriaceae bacterium]
MAGAILDVTRLGFPWQTRDPFLFCVHHVDAYPAGNDRLGPAASLAGRELGMDFAGKDGWRMYHGETVPGFPQHPHRGFETVTVVRRGLVDHADSLGAAARYGRGDVQWLTAGAGISHSEMFPLVDASAPNPVELFQIWLNLPRRDKLVAPHFTMLWADAIPRHREPGVEITVVAGALGDAVPPAPPPDSWAARGEHDVAIWTIRLDPGARVTLPPARAGSDRTLYAFSAAVTIDGRAIDVGSGVSVRGDVALAIEAGAGAAELLLLQGRPIGEPVAAHGPFVMTTRGELQQAFADYQRTRFGGWPWPTDDPVHGRDERFARHADGRVERARTASSATAAITAPIAPAGSR